MNIVEGLQTYFDAIRFRRNVSRSVENKTIIQTPELICRLTQFLFDHQTALETLGANSADFELLQAINNPALKETNCWIAKKDVKLTIHLRLPTKRENLFCAITVDHIFNKSSTNSGRIVFSGYLFQSGEWQVLKSGFECLLFNSLEEVCDSAGNYQIDQGTITIPTSGRTISYAGFRGERYSQIVLTHIGTFPYNQTDQHVYVGIIRNYDRPHNGVSRKIPRGNLNPSSI